MPTRRNIRQALDTWFPTLVRYLGIGVIIYGSFTMQAGVITAGVGMILFKTVYGDGQKD